MEQRTTKWVVSVRKTLRNKKKSKSQAHSFGRDQLLGPKQGVSYCRLQVEVRDLVGEP